MASGSPAMNKIERAHQMYRDGKYADALDYYTDALSMAKTTSQRIALHSNRAACYLKLHDFDKDEEILVFRFPYRSSKNRRRIVFEDGLSGSSDKLAAEECTSVLELDYKHTGALMLRAQTLVTLKQYHSALFDVNRLIELNPSSEVYRNLQARLKTQVSLAPIPEDEAECEEDDNCIDEAEQDVSDEEEKNEDKKANDQVTTAKDAAHTATIANSKTSDFENVSLADEVSSSQNQITKRPPNQQSSGWQTIPKPKGHSNLDYSRWDRVQDESSEEETDDDDDDDDCQPQYRFRVKTVGVRAVK